MCSGAAVREAVPWFCLINVNQNCQLQVLSVRWSWFITELLAWKHKLGLSSVFMMMLTRDSFFIWMWPFGNLKREFRLLHLVTYKYQGACWAWQCHLSSQTNTWSFSGVEGVKKTWTQNRPSGTEAVCRPFVPCPFVGSLPWSDGELPGFRGRERPVTAPTWS